MIHTCATVEYFVAFELQKYVFISHNNETNDDKNNVR